MLDWVRVVVNYCIQIIQYPIYVGSGFSISVWNVFVFGVTGYLLLKIIYGLWE